MTDVIEAVAVDVTEERLPARFEAPTQVMLGSAAIALMGDEEFERNLRALGTARRRAEQIQMALMKEGTDYGKVPGVDRPFLHKPGAETLDKAWGLAIRFEATRVIGDGEQEPPIAFHVKGFAHVGNFEGPVVAQGYGEANAWEERYRWRNAQRACPDCGKPNIIKSKPPRTGYWCGTRDGGCGHSFKADDERITLQETGRIENGDPWGLANTLLKMAVKRAHVDTTLRATGTSGLFTQDEDSPVVARQGVPERPSGAESRADAERAGLSGTAKASGNDDFALRQGPDGPVIPFRLTEGRKSWKAVAHGPLAELIAEYRDGIEGQPVTCWGHFEDKSFQKGSETIHYQVLVVDRLKAGDLDLSAPEADDLDEITEAELDQLMPVTAA